MKTLWIKILGFSSGRTGWVLNDGQAPYSNPEMTPNGESGIVCRFEEDGCNELRDMIKKAESIKILSYGADNHNEVSHEQVEQALDPWMQGEDLLCDLKP